PVWIMRQAGRYLPEYRAVRVKFDNFMDMCRNADACCEVALHPLQRSDLDAAIVFSDILTIQEAMGMDLKFIKGAGP
ncbi:uroporphyrinogen decarboxylase, partial [Francisella tularensis subsp. holarctica]|uniref:uroporphyrinogen decarboxylase family protein n=1 Tax=Francisella tularensis TaxID=263 RepID=UPI002381AF77